ncbi:Uncharacterized conserved protein YbbK, DUF523 family [Aliiroseovarius crassostreae]|uniref:Purine nucleoside phosphorylase n=1 Tax=Aliiroseovarius crassostreae TaxID=154981 RepID=A0A0P7J154_9RHOB|nr:DUF523 domain-containing protein [Aliiroseovarius crassostreae]KPN64926.1 purine nucleoside phosphorylase [Aliiroseovarius crassostreae]SFU61626.1 Uncharacterized conserved protein YbbK, DUF523 family [Aliiroseovarius crassostreae]
MSKRTRVLISACLLGQKVRYDGQAKMLPGDPLSHLEGLAELIPFCPELAGGLPVPRSPAEIEPGFCGDDVLAGRARVLDLSGEDVTAAFIEGAQKAVTFALAQNCTHALLTEASPSCGSRVLYSGHHDGQKRAGHGVTTSVLRLAGIAVFSPDELEVLCLELGRS